MGWDLIPIDEDIEPFHVARYAWLFKVANALRFTGAEMNWFADTNDGDYVPETVAIGWADNLEKGISGLKCAVINHSGSGPFRPGAVGFLVPEGFSEEEAMRCFNRSVDETCHQSQLEDLAVERIEEAGVEGKESTTRSENGDKPLDDGIEDCEIFREIAALSIDLFQEDEVLTFERFEDINEDDKKFLLELAAFFRSSKGFYQD